MREHRETELRDLLAALRFEGLTFAIPSGTTEIGRAVAQVLLRRGANVAISGAEGDEESLSEAAVALSLPDADQGEARAGRLLALPRPTGGGGTVRLADRTVEVFGSVDALINTGRCGFPVGDFEDLSPASVEESWQHHVSSAFEASKAFWQHLVASRGGIVNIGDLSGILEQWCSASIAHDLGQGGLLGMTRSLTASGEHHDVSVTCLLAGAEGSTSCQGMGQRDLDALALGAAYLAHPAGTGTGGVRTVVQGRLGSLASYAAAGYQSSAPQDLTVEEIADHLDEVTSRHGAIAPTTSAEYNAFRVRIYEECVI